MPEQENIVITRAPLSSNYRSMWCPNMGAVTREELEAFCKLAKMGINVPLAEAELQKRPKLSGDFWTLLLD